MTRIARGAELRLVFSSGDAGLRLTAKAGSTSVGPLSLPATAAQARRSLHEQLLEFKDDVPDELDDVSLEHAAAALLKLRTKGRILAYNLFGGYSAFSHLQKFCVDVLPQAAASVDDPPLVVVEAPDEFLPVELLPLLEPRWPPRLNTKEDIEAAAGCFLGFAAVTRRVAARRTIPQDPVLRRAPTLPVAFFHDWTMPGAEREATFLRTLGRRLALDEGWSGSARNVDEVAEALSRRIFAARGSTVSIGDQIQHFACHCFSGEAPATAWSIRLETAAGSADVGMELLIDKLGDQWHELDDERPSLPLVFMNACGTSTIDPSSAISFVDVFLDNGNRGFIGTETRVPDVFAAAFSGVFYDRLLAGENVGHALHHARWALLRGNNPLGILYTLYGNPNLHVEPPFTKEKRDDRRRRRARDLGLRARRSPRSQHPVQTS